VNSILVSIIITTHNRPILLARCLENIRLLIENERCEVIVVDDGSEMDGSLIEKYSNKNFTYIRRKNGASLPKSRNIGLGFSQGRYIIFCDDDDYLIESTIFTFIKEVDRFAYNEVFFFSHWRVKEVREETPPHEVDRKLIQLRPESFPFIEIGNLFPVGSYIVPREVALKTGFDETFKTHEDWDFLLMIRESTRWRGISYPLCVITTDAGSNKSMLSTTRKYHGIDHLMVYRKHASKTDEVRQQRIARLNSLGMLSVPAHLV
jgi:glycosyltransferase involved in cell wall biosynthesis